NAGGLASGLHRQSYPARSIAAEQSPDFFSCNWKLGSDEDADEQAQVLAQGISGCFPGGLTIPARTSGSGTSYRYIAESINYTDRANPSSRRVSLRINVEP
ncbi:hypothetical protein, partial [Massilia sp. TSP1-1-2]|uniref:hypothetical protein n=1 Tax=Massilia sp. TSP1-1-2 TaxID=2804649 RepID=UPI003CF2E2FD